MNKTTKQKALQKISNFCAYQERSPAETLEKLISYGLNSAESEEILHSLVKEGFVNEQRFALQYAGSKFRLKHWGKRKIQYALKLKGISQEYITEALASIDMDDYYTTLEDLARQKISTLNKETTLSRSMKTTAFLLQKGYSQSDIQEIIKTII